MIKNNKKEGMGIEMVCIKNKLLHSSPPKSIDTDGVPCLILWIIQTSNQPNDN